MKRVGLGLVLVVLTVAGPAVAQPKKARRETEVSGRPVSAWVKDLEGGKAEAVVPALNALMRAGPEAKPAVPALVRLIQADASFVQVIAVLTLAKVGPDAGPALREALKGKSPRGRELAAKALGLIGDPASASSLIAALGDGEPAVRRNAIASLRQLNATAAAAELKKALTDEDEEARVEAASALWQVGKDAAGVDVLAAACKSKDEEVVLKALAALSDVGPKAKGATDAVKALLKHESLDVRLAAGPVHFRLTGDAEAGLGAVATGLKDADGKRRAAAALAAFRDTEGGRALATTLLADEDAAVRREAATWAGPEALKKALVDADAGVRWWAALGLLAGKPERASEEELLTLREAQGVNAKGEANADAALNVANRDRAAVALAAILTDGPARLHLDAARALALPGMDARAALDVLLAKFRSDDKPLRRAAAEAVAGVGSEVLPRLKKLLDSEEPKAREAAARAVGRLGVPARGLTPALAGRLRDPESAVRTQAALALWSVEGESEVPLTVLDLVLKDVDNADRWEAAEAVGVIATGARPAIKGLTEVLVTGLKDRDVRVRATASKWLWRLVKQSKPVIPLLKDVLGGRDPFARLIAVETLGELDTEANPGPLLVAALEEKDAMIRLAAIEGLARVGDGAALVKALAGPKRTADGARLAFGRMGKGKAAAEYVEALGKKDEAALKRLEKVLAPE